jgi:predicted metal-dependent phosphoesterase TrpH
MTTKLLSYPPARNLPLLRETFSSIDINSCPHKYNFHLHTNFSDGRLHPQGIINQAISIGLEGLAITDHHSVKGYYIAQEYLNDLDENQGKDLPQFWTGIEITANLLQIDIHILGYAFNPENEHLQPYLTGKSPLGEEAKAENVINAIKQAGGITVLAHPARYKKPVEDVIIAAAKLGIDGVETYYAYGNPNPWFSSHKETEKVKELANFYDLYNTCGTDTHGQNILVRL